MELHNALLRGPFSDALLRALGQQQGVGGLERFGETLTPVIDLWSLPEWSFLRGERLCGAAATAAAGAAATYAAVALRCPAGSNMIAVVELCLAATNVATVVSVGLTTESSIDVALTADVLGSNCDTRFANATTPVCFLSSGATATNPLASRISYLARPVLLSIPEAERIVLTPGYGVVIQNDDDAAAIHVAFRWRERKAGRGEL